MKFIHICSYIQCCICIGDVRQFEQSSFSWQLLGSIGWQEEEGSSSSNTMDILVCNTTGKILATSGTAVGISTPNADPTKESSRGSFTPPTTPTNTRQPTEYY